MLHSGRDLCESLPRFVWQWNKDQGLATPSLHVELAEWLETCWRNGDHRLVLTVFRNAGKSTLVALYASWLLHLDPNLRILVVSAEQALAVKMTRNIRQVIGRHLNTAHIRLSAGDEWAADRLTVCRSKTYRDPSVLARGLQGNLTGSRADVVICDDVEVPNTCDTPGKRRDLRQRLKELDFVLVPGGTSLFVGTPHNFYSIYSTNIDPGLGEEKPCLDGFLRKQIAVVDKAGTSRWPERFNADTLNNLAKKVGPQQYKSQMLLEPTHHSALRLDPNKLRTYSGEIEIAFRNGRRELSIAGNLMVGAACWWDPAYGKPDSGDGSVVACVFTDRVGVYWLHDIAYLTFDSARLVETDEASQLCEHVVAFAIRNEQPSVIVENNGLGRFLPGLLRRAAAAAGQPLQVTEATSTTTKARRILEAFDPLLASGHLNAHERIWSTAFIREMSEWRAENSSRDDGLDAVAGCLRSQPVRLPTQAPIANRHAATSDWRIRGRQFMADTRFVV